MLFELNNYSHVAFGSLALLGGVIALAARKGSRPHIVGGRIFAYTMVAVVLTTLLAMIHNFLPLAIVLSVAEIYLIPSAILTFRRDVNYFRPASIALMVLTGLLSLFTAIQFVRLNITADQLFMGPAVLSAMFGYLFAQDWYMLRHKPTQTNYLIRRHLVRMILAFTIAIMALVRIGTDFGLSLEASVVVPLVIAFAAIFVVQRRYPI